MKNLLFNYSSSQNQNRNLDLLITWTVSHKHSKQKELVQRRDVMRQQHISTLLLFCFVCYLFFLPSKTNATELHFDVSAKSAILIEQESGRILFEKEADTKRRIASITKIMTAILAVESGKLQNKIKIREHSINIEGSSIYLEKDELITLEDLVYGLMLRSGNDAAVAIANAVGGSVDGFVYLMNEKAKELGMTNTMFANPHGLDDSENHFSTAYDMAILTQYAMKNEKFKEIFGAKNYKSYTSLNNEEKVRYWKNKNKLLTGLYNYSTGGKTGYTKRAKRTLVSTASKDNLNLIAVTLDAPSDWHDHMRMFENAFQNYETLELLPAGKYTHVNDKFYKNKLMIKHPVYYPLTEEEREKLKSTLILLIPPKGDEWIKEGVPEPVGRLKVKLDEKEIASVPLFFDGNPTNENESFIKKLKNLIFLILKVEQK